MSLTLVANRAPIRLTSDGWVPALGGLATALLPVLEKQGGAWIAMREPGDDAPLRQEYPEVDPRFTICRIPLTTREYEDYYEGMSNSVLWPLCHYMLDRMAPDRAFRDVYRSVNERFVDAILNCGADKGPFWIQDYHLMLLPEALRKARPDAQIGHFWHIPWPSVEVYRVLPAARELLRGLLGASLVGFHVEEYAENFRNAARVLLGARIEGEGIQWEGRRVRVEAHPIGVNTKFFTDLAKDEDVKKDAAKFRKQMGVEHLILSVDRLDYTKGLLSRLSAYEEFLNRYPDYHGRVSLYQIATPSRTGIDAYQQLKREIDEAVGRINGIYGNGSWQPIYYRYRAFRQEDLASLYHAADVALLTPLRDGMNLVAHEYVLIADNGVLLLSELTGAAALLDGAVLVNPYDTDGMVSALKMALEMPSEERKRRMDRTRKIVSRLDVHRWAERFLDRLSSIDDSVRELTLQELTP